jgi:hypothetical protein
VIECRVDAIRTLGLWQKQSVQVLTVLFLTVQVLTGSARGNAGIEGTFGRGYEIQVLTVQVLPASCVADLEVQLAFLCEFSIEIDSLGESIIIKNSDGKGPGFKIN